MALIHLSRRIPTLRYLSALANSRDVLSGIHSSASCASNSAAGPDAVATDKEKVAAGEAVASGSAASPTPVSADSATTAATASTSQPTPAQDDDEWTEVVHTSGQVYYWNQRTGETTQLGEPKPQSDGRGSRGGSSSGGRGDGGGRAADAHTHDPRAEAPLEDRTGTYAAMGVIIGAFLGWVSQFV